MTPPDQPASRIAIGRITQEHTTALYFERAAKAAGHDVTVIHTPDIVPAPGTCDLFLVVDPWFHGLHYLPRLACPTAVVLIDVHRDMTTRSMFARYFDHVFVAQQEQVAELARNHSSVQWLPLASDPEVHFVPSVQRDIDLGFVGKMDKPGTERFTVLSRVLTRFTTNAFDKSYTPWEMGKVYSRSKIVFNKSIGGDLNMRVFEALAAGALLITDRIGNGLDDLLTEGLHYIGYDTAEEAIGQIERYLSDDAARIRIAKAGQDLLRARHTYEARLAQIFDTVEAADNARPAPARQASRRQRLRWRAEWARHRGTGLAAATGLMAEGLSPAAYGDLAIGLARRLRQRWHTFSFRSSKQQT